MRISLKYTLLIVSLLFGVAFYLVILESNDAAGDDSATTFTIPRPMIKRESLATAPVKELRVEDLAALVENSEPEQTEEETALRQGSLFHQELYQTDVDGNRSALPLHPFTGRQVGGHNEFGEGVAADLQPGSYSASPVSPAQASFPHSAMTLPAVENSNEGFSAKPMRPVATSGRSVAHPMMPLTGNSGAAH
jgi:hypothetical protein